ncbi:PA2817 family protein [Amphritea sp. 1_MG-2023]|uniref:PA2817 family protein n=1 Tax=Amphritea sp. 1_MG-2023 TaxID=3062670 RepID=UPI0026E43782|nr:PA2817 family protein [Amphritea sp. 1_MG-2023]MDO6563735.1 PA2817 family protein [Amphritea sp. 1_MG-2023]
MNAYQFHHLNFLKIAYNNFIRQEPFTLEDISTEEEQFILDFQQLIHDFEESKPTIYEDGEIFFERAFRMYPQLAHLIARDLLWFFGGNCLHNMADIELEKFQRLDELRFAAEEQGEEFDYINTRASLFAQN